MKKSKSARWLPSPRRNSLGQGELRSVDTVRPSGWSTQCLSTVRRLRPQLCELDLLKQEDFFTARRVGAREPRTYVRQRGVFPAGSAEGEAFSPPRGDSEYDQNQTCLAIFILSLWGLTVRSQVLDSPGKQGSVYTLRVYQDLVVVDVVVTDKKGNPVKNLTRDNFTVYRRQCPPEDHHL